MATNWDEAVDQAFPDEGSTSAPAAPQMPDGDELARPHQKPGDALWGARKRHVTQAALEDPAAPAVREPNMGAEAQPQAPVAAAPAPADRWDQAVEADLSSTPQPEEQTAQAQGDLTFAAWQAAHSPQQGATKHDDTENLEGLTGWLTWPLRAAWSATRDAAKEQALNASTARELWFGTGPASPELLARQQELSAAGEKNYGAESFLGKAFVGGVRMLPPTALDMAARAVGGLAGGALGALAGVPEVEVGGPLIGGFSGEVLGQGIGSTIENYYQAAPQLFLRLQTVRDEQGDPLDPSTIRWAANLGGLANGALMGLAGGPMGTKLAAAAGGESAKNLLGKLGGEAIADALARPGMGAALGRYLARVGTHEASGALVSALGGAVNAATEELAKGDGATVAAPAVAKAFGDSFLQGLNDMLFLGLGHAALETRAASKASEVLRTQLVDQGQESTSMTSAMRLQGILDSAAKSETLKAVPAEVEKLAARAKTAPGAIKEVLIDRGAVDRLAQEQGIEPRELGRKLAGDDGSAYDRAGKTGSGAIVVPIEKYVRAAGSPEARALFLDSRLYQEELTPRQVQAEAERIQKRAQDLSQLPLDQMEESQRRVYEDWKARARGAGRSEQEADVAARHTSAFFATQAERFSENGTPTTAEDLRNAYDVRMRGARGQHLGEQPPPAKPDLGLQEAMRAKFEAFETPEKQARFFTDQTTGLYSFRGYEAREPDPSRPYTTELQVAQAKTLNDTAGHEAGDNALKVMGNVLRSRGIPDAVRRENTVSFDHATPEEGEAAAKAIEERLGGGLVVTHGTAKAEEGASSKARLEAAAAEHKATKEAGRKAGTIPERDAPIKGEGLRARLEAEPTPERAKVAPAHEESFAEHLEKHEAFDTIHLNRDGTLTEDGFRLARKVAEESGKPVHFVSADARGIGKLNEMFGRDATDEIMAHLSRAFIDGNGAAFNVSHPHGDEFYALTVGDPKKLTRLFRQVAAATDKTVFWKLDGDVVTYQEGVKLAHGLGSTFDEADSKALPAAKAAQRVDGPQRIPKAKWDALERTLRREGHEPIRVGGAALRADEGAREAERPGRRRGGAPTAAGRAEGGGESGDRSGEAGGESAGLGPVYVAPGVELHPNFEAPTQAGWAGAERLVASLRSPTRRAAGEDFMGAVRDHLNGEGEPGQMARALAALPRDLESRLAYWGVMDPVNGFRQSKHAGTKAADLSKVKTDEGAKARAAAQEEEMSNRFGLKQEDLPEGGSFQLEAKGRGYISFTPGDGGAKRRFDIQFLANADKSTLAHETFHFLSEVMGDLAQRADAPESLKADYATLHKFMGFESHEDRVKAANVRRGLQAKADAGTATEGERDFLRRLAAKEERGSHAWEQFLLEGRSPSVELAGPFARLRNWMLKIYSGVQGIEGAYRKTYGEEIGLSDDVRQVFGRMLASDEEVRRQQASDASSQPFDALRAKMTPEERAKYDEATQRAAEEARSRVTRGIAEATRRENTKEFAAERERLRGEVDAELDRDPVQRALKYLKTGEAPEALADVLKGEDGKPYKLDRKALTKEYGPEFVKSMPRDIFAAKGEKGIDADELAPLLGMEDGRSLVESLQKAPSRSKAVESEVQSRLEALYGPSILDDHQALAEEAISGLHNPAAIEKALIERRWMAEKLTGDGRRAALNLDPEVYRRQAARMVGELTVADLTRGRDGAAGAYLRAERAAARRAQEAVEAGKLEEALGHNEAQILNAHLWREARDARDRMESAQGWLEKAAGETWQTALGKADVAAGDTAYRDATNGLLQAVGYQEGNPDPRALDALLSQVSAENVGFDVEGARELLAKPQEWADLTQEQAQNLADAVRNIRHAASFQTGLELAGKRIDRAELLQRMTEAAAKGPQLPPKAASESSKRPGEAARALGRGWDAYLTSIQNYVETLDGGDRDGPFHQLFVDELRERQAKVVELDKAITLKVKAAIDAMPKELRRRSNEIVPGLSDILPVNPRFAGRMRGPETRAELWSVFLNSGNEGNAQRLRDGNGWSDEQRQRALNLLHPEEARFLQGILDAVESLKPELGKVHRERTGLPMPEVQATQIHVGGETFRGGYFPLRYDPTISRQGAAQETAVEKELFPGGYNSPTVFSGHTKARAEKVEAPLSLEFGTVQAHLADVIQDIAFGDWVRKAGSVVASDQFRAAVDTRLGPERTRLFMPWLRDIALERRGSAAGAMDSTPSAVRMAVAMAKSRYAQAAVGLNLASMLAHATDPLAALVAGNASTAELPGRAMRIASAYAKTLAPGVRPEFALSKELALRSSKELDNFRRELADLNLSPSKVGAAAQSALRTVDHVSNMARFYVDRFHARVLWLTGYEDGLSKGMTQADAARRGDDFLSQTLPSGAVSEKPVVLRAKTGIASVITLYGYASKMFNLWVHQPLATATDVWATPGATRLTKAAAAADLAGKWLAMGAVGVLGAKLANRGPKEDDEDKHEVPWAVRRMLLEPTNTLPIFGPAIEAAVEGREASVRTAPGAQLMYDAAAKISKLARDGQDHDVWQKLEALGAGLGPAAQASKTFGYVHAVQAGDVSPQGPGDWAAGLIYGAPRR